MSRYRAHMGQGIYLDGRTFDLPGDWVPAEPAVLDLALGQASIALGIGRLDPVTVRKRLFAYFNPESKFAGALFNTVDGPSNAQDDVTAADLLAVTTLSIELDPRQIRQLTEAGIKRSQVLRALGKIDPAVPIEELGSGGMDTRFLLGAVSDFYREVRSTPKSSSNRWVFASKLGARKRPRLLPVRDNVVCKFLGGVHNIRDTSLGSHDIDLQVFGYLMSAPEIQQALHDWWAELRSEYGRQLDDVPPLRLLDVALWNAGIAQGYN